MKPVIITKELVSEGMSVMRGRDWNYLTSQDGKAGNRGIVKTIGEPPGWCLVEWENGGKYSYRIGYCGKFDLYTYIPGFYDPVVKPERLTHSNGAPGTRVVLNENASIFAKQRLLGISELIVEGFSGPDVRIKGVIGAFMTKSFDIAPDQSSKEPVPAHQVYNVGDGFAPGTIVYFKGVHDLWTKDAKLVEDRAYIVTQISPTSMKLDCSKYWFSKAQFMTETEWYDKRYKEIYPQTTSTAMPIVDMKKLQGGVVAIAENSKPNIKQNGINTDNPDYSGRTLELPSVIISLERGERVEGSRLYC